jgi:hypothetical protein
MREGTKPEQAEQGTEVCICAAVRLDDGTIFRGKRHDNAMKLAIESGMAAKIRQEHQGFMTSRDRWVSREEGSSLQNAAGILSVWTNKPIDGMLFSEDLY